MGLIEQFDEINTAFNSLDFRTRLSLTQQVESIRHTFRMIKYDGYLKLKDCFGIRQNKGEYYVYLWKHMRGDIFYVGSGKGNRCIQKNRGIEFFKHLDKGDVIVYIVLDGTDKETARFYERYLSGCLSDIGQPLTNKDNVISRMGKDVFEGWLRDNSIRLCNTLTKDIENVVLNKILCDKDFTYDDILSKEEFLEENGDHYFSSEEWRTVWNQQSNMV